MAKEPRDYVNPKWLLRQIMKALPPVEYVHPTVNALWAHSNEFIEKDDIVDGNVSFSGSISYGQLAEFCGIDYETAKWRMKQLRDKYELVEWERAKLCIRFTFGVRLSGNGLTDSDETVNGLPDSLGSPYGKARAHVKHTSSQVTEESSQVTKQSSQVMDGVESGNGLPTLAFDLAHLAKITGSVVTQQSRFAQTRENPGPHDNSASANPATESSRPPVETPQGLRPRTPTEASRLETPGISVSPVGDSPIPPPPAPEVVVHYSHKMEKSGKGKICRLCISHTTCSADRLAVPCKPGPDKAVEARAWREQYETQAEGAAA